jgi:hypothetical protein
MQGIELLWSVNGDQEDVWLGYREDAMFNLGKFCSHSDRKEDPSIENVKDCKGYILWEPQMDNF